MILPKYSTKKWIEIFDQSYGSYSVNKDIKSKTSQLRNDLCDINDAYIVVAGKFGTTNPGNDIDKYDKKVALKYFAPFLSCELRINSEKVDFCDDLYIVMSMYNLLYYSKNFRKTTGSFWNYHPDMLSSGYDNNNRDRIFYSIKDSKRKKITGSLGENMVRDVTTTASLEDIKIVAPLKNLSNFTFNLEFLMINTEIELILKWSQNRVLTGKATREAIAKGDDTATEPAVNAINRPSDLKFNITDSKLYVPVVNLLTEYQKKLYEELKKGISIDFVFSKYRSQAINQTATNNVNYLIDPTFNNVNRLFVLAFPSEKDRNSFSEYYTPTVEIKDYYVILNGTEPFYEIPIRNKEETYKEITELIRNGIFRKGNEINYEYFCNYYKLIAIDLSRQKSDF